MQDPNPQQKSGTGRGIKIVLVLSLALNLLVVGAIAGSVLSGDRRDMRRAVDREMGATPFSAALEPSERRALARQLREELGAPLMQVRRELRGRFEELLTALRAEDFDRSAVEALLAEQRSTAASRQEIGEKVLLDHLEQLDPDARRAYAERLDKSLRRFAPR